MCSNVVALCFSCIINKIEFYFRQPPAEVSDSDVVSQSAFSQPKMNEMSTPDHPTPAVSEKKVDSMRAMLSSNGSIKIIISSSDESSGGEENPKEVTNSDDSGVDSGAAKKSKSSASKSSEVNSSTTFTSSAQETSRAQEDDDDDDELSQYKQSPRAVFLSTVCHVSAESLQTFIIV